MCWCANGYDCELTKHFQMDSGSVTLIGPAPQFQDRTCVSGQACVTAGILGQDLGDGDRVMILETCGLPTVPGRFVNDGMSDALTHNGSHSHWGGYEDCDETWNFDCAGVRPTSKGGDYRLCWCAHNYTCTHPTDYRVDFGMLTLIGPNPVTNKRTCVAGQPCGFQEMLGHFVQDGDHIMLMDTCGKPERRQLIQVSDRNGITFLQQRNVPQYGFFDGHSNPASADGTAFHWGDGGDEGVGSMITAPGGLYRLCWCGYGFDCEVPEDFQTDAGSHEVVGPFFLLPDSSGLLSGEERLQNFVCTSNEPCELGNGEDDYVILLICALLLLLLLIC